MCSSDLFVVNLLWTVTGVDGSNTASIDGNSQFTVQEGTFTPYDQLTEAQVLEWVFQNIQKDTIEAQLQVEIDNQVSPPVVYPPLPWVSEA